MSFDEKFFAKMKNTALEILQGREKKEYAQAIVLLTAKGNVYAAFTGNVLSQEKSDEKNLIRRLVDANDTEIAFILSLWQSGEIDIPSYDFRKMLLNLDPRNSDSEIFVLTGNGISVIKLGITLKA